MADPKTALREYLDTIPIVDAHEHLRPPSIHEASEYTFFDLFRPYIQYDLVSAGLPARWFERGPETPDEIDQCWNDVEPVWQYVKHGSYARSTLLAIKEFWGFGDITRSNYRELGDLLNATRQPGHYRKVLVEKCGLSWVLNQVRQYAQEEPFMKGAFVLGYHLWPSTINAFLERHGRSASLDDYIEFLRREIHKAKVEGAIQVKFDVCEGFCRVPDAKAALTQFDAIRREEDVKDCLELGRLISERVLGMLPETGLVAAVHTGVWHDIRDQNPEHLFAIVAEHPEVTFDVYHMGIPYARECGFLGKNYHNVYLNLCWSHIISPEMVVRTLGEWMDYVPTNKVFGFGGDFLFNPEQTWGHLQVAKDNLADVFGREIAEGTLGLCDAKQILRLWLYDNPARVYCLD